MAQFDIENYFDRRTYADLTRTADNSSGMSKYDELMAASNEKATALSKITQDMAQRQVASEGSLNSMMGLDPDGVVGTVVDVVASGIEGIARIPGNIGSGLHTLNAAALDAKIPDAAKQADVRRLAGTATPEDMVMLALPAGLLKEPVWQSQMQKESRPGVRTNQQRIEDMKEALRKADVVRQGMDLSGLVHKGKQQVMAGEVRAGYRENAAKMSEGWDGLTNGSPVSGAGQVASGITGLFMNIGSAAINNKAASLEYIAANAPQLILAAGGAAGMAITNLPYAVDQFGKSLSAYLERNGTLPPEAETRELAAWAGSLALMETVGDKLTLGGFKAGKTATKEAAEATRKGFKDRLMGAGKAIVNSAPTRVAGSVLEGGMGEFVTEAYQSSVEMGMEGKTPTAEDAYAGGTVGAISGGLMAGGGRVIGEMTKSTPEIIAQKSAEVAQIKVEQATFNEAIKANDTSAYLNPEASSYNPARAIGVLNKNSQLAETPPEAKQANIDKAHQIVTNLDNKYQDGLEVMDEIKSLKTPEAIAAKQAGLDNLKTRLAATDAADTQQVEDLKGYISFNEEVLRVAGDPVALKAKQSELGGLQRQLKEVRTAKDQMVGTVSIKSTPEEVTAQVALVNTLATANDTPEITAARTQAATSLINLSMASPGALSHEVASQMAENTSSGLDDAQRSYLREFSKARIAENALMDLDKVGEDILKGNFERNQVGILQHRERISGALQEGNQRAADRHMALLAKFEAAQADKFQTAISAMQKFADTGKTNTIISTDTGWQVTDKVFTKDQLAKNGSLEFNGGSKNLLKSMELESTALTLVLAEQQAAYGLKFNIPVVPTASTVSAPLASATPAPGAPSVSGDVSNKEKKTNLSPAPVQKAKESVQVPAVQSTTSKSPPKESIISSRGDGVRVNDESSSPLAAEVSQPASSSGGRVLALNPIEDIRIVTEHAAADTANPQTDNDFTGITFREASAQEAAVYSSAVQEASVAFPVAAAATSFLVHDGHRWQGGAFSSVGPDTQTDHHTITLNGAAFVVSATNTQEQVSQHVKKVVTHELAHIQDAQEGWSTDRTPALQQGGRAYEEAKAASENPTIPKDKAAILTKWFNHVVSPTFDKRYVIDPKKPGQEKKRGQEMFAQLHALYAVHPELMKEYLPYAYNAITKNRAAHSGRVDADQSVSDTRRRTETGGQPTIETNGTEQSRVPGGIGEVPPSGKLAALATKSPEDTPFKLRNLIADYFTQKSGNDRDVTLRPLVEVKDFLSQWIAEKIDTTDFLKGKDETLVLSAKQDEVLSLFKEKAATWAGLFQKELKLKTDKNYNFDNLVQFLIEVTETNGKTKLDLEENVKTAMSYAAFSWVAENAGKSQYNTPEEINLILNRDEDTEVGGNEFAVLGKVGTRENVVRNALGQKAVQALGLKATKGASKELMSKLESAIGAYIQKMLMEPSVGLLKRSTVAGKDMAELTGNETTNANASFQFLALVRDKEGKPVAEAEAIYSTSKDTQSILDKLFSVESGLKEPSLKPIPFKQSTTKGTLMGIPAKLARIVAAKNAEANYLRQDMWSLMGKLAPEVALAMAGTQEVSDATVQKSRREGMQAKNDGLHREYENFMGYVNGTLAPIDADLQMPLFFEHSVWKQQRVGIATNVINSQSSKIHRFMLFRKAWETKLESTDTQQMDNFRLRVLEGLGVKTDKQANTASLLGYDKKVGSPAIQAAVAVLVRTTMLGEDMTSMDQQVLLEGVKEGGSNFHSLDALMALAHESFAMGNAEGKPYSFTVQMMGEIDGVTNGPMLSHLLMGAASSVGKLFGLLNKGGFYEQGNEHSNYNVWRGSPGKSDLYESTALHMTQVAQSFMQDGIRNAKGKQVMSAGEMSRLMSAIYSFTGSLVDGETGKVEKAGRNIIKTPLTAMVFGSSVSSAIDSMAEKFIEAIYGSFEDLAKGEGDRVLVTKNLNLLLGNQRISTNTPVADLMELEFSKPQKEAIKQVFSRSLGAAVKVTMQQDFAAFIEARKTFNDAANMTFELYNAAYTGMREAFIQELIDKEKATPGTGMAYTTSKTGVDTAIQDLTATQEAELRERLKDLSPLMHTLMSQDSNDLRSGLLISKTAKKLSTQKSYSSNIEFATPFADNGAKSVNTHGNEVVETAPGVAMLPIDMHSTDSAISHNAADGNEVLNVHDAHGTGLATFEKTAENLNKATWDAMLNYSPPGEMFAALSRTLTGLNALIQLGSTPPAVISNLKAALEVFAENYQDGVYPADVVLTALMTDAKYLAYHAEDMKLQALSVMASVDQYALEVGNYEVTDKDRAEAVTKQATLVKDLTAQEQASMAAIQAKLGYVVAVKAPAVEGKQDSATSSGMDDQEPFLEPREEAADPTTAGTIKSYSTADLYDALGTGTINTGFDSHIRSILSSIVEKLHGPFGSFKESLMSGQVGSPINVFEKAMATGVAPFASRLMASGFGFTDQTAFVAEQVEATVRAALEGNDNGTAATYSELAKLFVETRNRIKLQDFHPGDWATATTEEENRAEALYNFIFNEMDKSKGDKVDYLARFAALGLAHEGFNKLLQVPTARMQDSLAGKTIAEALKYLFGKLLSWFNSKLTHTSEGQQADAKLTALVQQLVDIEGKKKASLNRKTLDLLGPVEDKIKDVAEGIRNKAEKFGKSAFFQDNKNEFFKATGNLMSAVAGDRVQIMLAGIDKMREQQFKGKLGMVGGILNDIKGPKAMEKLLLLGTGSIMKHRKFVITQTAKGVLESFVGKGAKLTKEAKEALTAVMLRTGAHVLMDHFDMAQLETMMNGEAALQAAVTDFEGKLSGFHPRHQAYFLRNARDLGYYLATNENKGEFLLMNAGNIARMYGSTSHGRLSEAQTTEAEAIIDVLTTLYALGYTRPADRAEVATMLRNEAARTDGGNGVQMVLLSHKALEQQSRERLFAGSEALMSKGYTPEIYNPYTDIKVANALEGRALMDAGYSEGALVEPDSNDPDREAKRIYSLRDGGPQPWLTGILSYTGMRAKGSTQYLGRNAKAAVDTKKQQAIQAMFTPNPGYDPAKVKGSKLAPILNAAGEGVNYHYLMKASTKDSILERDSRFDQVLGTHAGSIYDKESTVEHNRKAIQALKDQYDADYAENPEAYVEVSLATADKEMREIFRMLPKATQKDVLEIWGKDGMMVRSDALDINFGYRKLSLSNIFEKEAWERNWAEKTFATVVEWNLEIYARTKLKMNPADAKRYAMRSAVTVKRAEHIWQAIVQEMKANFVVKSISTLVGNISSNTILLSLHGVPLLDQLRYTKVALKGATDYQRDNAELFRLKGILEIGFAKGSEAETRRQIAVLEDALARNPVKELIDAGLMPTIVEDAAADEDLYSYKSRFVRKTEKYTDKLHPSIKAAGKVAYMAKDAQIFGINPYQTMSQITQLSDFVARYALYQHLTTRKVKPMAKEAAVLEALDSFIFYDIPMHRGLQYTDDMAITMFTKYFLRIQRILLQRTREAPGRAMMLLMLKNYFDWLPSVTDSSALAHLGNNPLGVGALKFGTSLDDIAVVKAGLSLFK